MVPYRRASRTLLRPRVGHSSHEKHAACARVIYEEQEWPISYEHLRQTQLNSLGADDDCRNRSDFCAFLIDFYEGFM